MPDGGMTDRDRWAVFGAATTVVAAMTWEAAWRVAAAPRPAALFALAGWVACLAINLRGLFAAGRDAGGEEG